MRVLLLLRGAPGCGKTTWIEQNGLKQYAISADDIRMMCCSPVLTTDGKPVINVSNDKVVWDELFKLLQIRMENGAFTVIDATNSKTTEMNRYKDLCDQYKYRMYCVDFTGVPIDVCKERNKQRPEYKWVPDEAIDKMYARLATQKIPSGIKVIQPDELDQIWMKKFDLSSYKCVHHIGDIHGCFTPLKEYLDMCGGIKDDEFWIFTGDYIDRGIENAEVVKFLLEIYEKPNALLLEGNHERWLWVWANGCTGKSKEFEFETKPQLEAAGIDKKEVRKLYRRLGQCAWYSIGEYTYFVNHAGVSTLPENPTLIPTVQYIKGVGKYNDFELVANKFVENTPDNVYQIHGHRNTKHLSTQVNQRVFNLEGQVEFGGFLRCVRVEHGGRHMIYEMNNPVFRQREEVPEEIAEQKRTVGDLILDMRRNRFVQEKKYGNISSLNFTKQAFYDKVWDEQTMKARGFFVDVDRQKIVARAYEKFFNVNEMPETKFDMLQYKLAFPVTAYVKENGFLGIVSYNEEDDSLFCTSKSDPTSEFSGWLREMLDATVDASTQNVMKTYAKTHNVSFVFECVDIVHDPHVIDYPESRLYLLDIIYNEIGMRKYSYDEMQNVAKELGLQCKEKAFVIDSWSEFFDWYYEVTSDDYLYNGRNIEGFVVEDQNGYMVKLKLAYYHFWKFMRSVAHEAIRKGYITRTSALTNALSNQFYGWVKTLHDTPDPDSVPRDICTLRRWFFESDAGKQFLAEGEVA